MQINGIINFLTSYYATKIIQKVTYIFGVWNLVLRIFTIGQEE